MILTEEEAKTRWCPFSSAAHWNAPTGGNRIMRNDAPSDSSPVAIVCRCLGSRCMAWRWVHALPGSEVGGFKRNNPDDNERVGFCGLAIHPEAKP